MNDDDYVQIPKEGSTLCRVLCGSTSCSAYALDSSRTLPSMSRGARCCSGRELVIVPGANQK